MPNLQYLPISFSFPFPFLFSNKSPTVQYIPCRTTTPYTAPPQIRQGSACPVLSVCPSLAFGLAQPHTRSHTGETGKLRECCLTVPPRGARRGKIRQMIRDTDFPPRSLPKREGNVRMRMAVAGGRGGTGG